MAHQRQLSTAIISLTRSVEADVKKYSQGAHREKIVAVEAACKVLLAENTALKQRLKTTKLDAMRLAYDPDLMVRVNERTYHVSEVKCTPPVKHTPYRVSKLD